MKPYYEQDGITIYHGSALVALDQMDGMRQGPVFDLLLTDPPYGIDAPKRGTIGSSKNAKVKDYGSADWDSRPATEAVAVARRLSRHQIIFGGNYYHLPPARCWLLWDKDNTGDFADAEMAWTNLDKAVRLLRYRWNGMLQEPGCPREFREHPTQKPEAVMRWALMQAPQDVRTVLDPFMGSGTTLVAAKRLGRQAVGIEREEHYCEIAAKRLQQGALFGHAMEEPECEREDPVDGTRQRRW
jgi:16S rRNA G966 N2-methylase RsmD